MTLPANATSVDIPIPTIDNSNDEIDGVVEATLVDRVGYDLASGVTPGYVDVYDNDGTTPQSISVAAVNATIIEGRG